MLYEEQEKTILYELYHCDPEDYSDLKVSDLAFPIRVTNRLLNNSILTVGDLLNTSYSKLRDIKGFGTGCIIAIDEYLSKLAPEKQEDDVLNADLAGLIPYRGQLFDGDYSFENEVEFSENEKQYIQRVKVARENLDEDLIEQCRNNSGYIIAVMKAFRLFHKANETLEKYISTIPAERLKNRAKGYICAYTNEEIKRNRMLNFCIDEDMTLISYLRKIALAGSDIKKNERFMEWCAYSLKAELEEFYNRLFAKENVKIVVQSRANGLTLQETGDLLGVTRERVRQIEKKACLKFTSWNNTHHVMSKISADRNGDDVLTMIELLDYLGEYFQETVFFLKTADFKEVAYDKQSDAFVIGDDSMLGRVREYIEEMPEQFHQNKYESIVQKAVDEYGLSGELIEENIKENYKHTGNIWHRTRLSLASMYAAILKNYYPNGVHVYDESELQKFINKTKEVYGDIKISTTYRALSTRIADVGVLCDRGCYTAKKEKYIPDDLLNRIVEYIDNSGMPLIMTNTIYYVFMDELEQYGIKNKYYLHGILRELVGEKYTFNRDYISKDSNATNMYMQIVGYIKRYGHPIEKDELKAAFPGITDIVLSLAIADSEVINLFGKYVHIDNLNLISDDEIYLENIMKELLKKSEIIHAKEIYQYVKNDYPELLANNHIYYAYSMFSLLECLFGEKYQFSRPFISAQGIEMCVPAVHLDNYVAEREIVDVLEFKEYANEVHFFIGSLIDTICAYSDTHLMINKEKFATHDYVGVNGDVANQIEQIIKEELLERNINVIRISDLHCIGKFPNIKLQWTEWLIYSALYNWATELQVGLTSKKFKRAQPLIAVQGYNFDTYNEDFSEQHKSAVTVDNLDDIDNLIEDMIEIDWGD